MSMQFSVKAERLVTRAYMTEGDHILLCVPSGDYVVFTSRRGYCIVNPTTSQVHPFRSFTDACKGVDVILKESRLAMEQTVNFAVSFS